MAKVSAGQKQKQKERKKAAALRQKQRKADEFEKLIDGVKPVNKNAPLRPVPEYSVASESAPAPGEEEEYGSMFVVSIIVLKQ